MCVCVQIDIRYATIVEPDFTIRVHLVGVFIATVSFLNPSKGRNVKCQLDTPGRPGLTYIFNF